MLPELLRYALLVAVPHSVSDSDEELRNVQTGMCNATGPRTKPTHKSRSS